MCLFFILLFGDIITRDAVISEASAYANYTWTVNTPNPRYKLYRVKGRSITGEAYSYGDKDMRSTFQANIDAGYIPRNWEENYNSGHTSGYTGIDCSGLVSKCWRTSITGTSNLVSLALQLANKNYLKPGDVLYNPEHIHIKIYAGNDKVYHAVGYDDTEDETHQKVIYENARYSGYQFYTIFPQFSSPQPEPNSGGNGNEVDISVVVEGSGEIEHPYMEVDGAEVPCSFSNGKITAHVNLDEVSPWNTGSRHTVEVIADNYVSEAGNDYRDDIEWSFYEEVAPPIVISTDPSNGLQNVPVDINQISITFSKPMDHTSTENAISASFSYTPSWVDEKTVNLQVTDTLDYLTEYTVTISDAAMDTSGIQLDGNGDGEYNREIVIREA